MRCTGESGRQKPQEIAYAPTNNSWLNRIEAQFTALRYFTLDGTDHAGHKGQGSMIRRYRHAGDRRLRAVVDRANVAYPQGSSYTLDGIGTAAITARSTPAQLAACARNPAC